MKAYLTKMILYQLMAIMGLALIVFLFKGTRSSLSALLGGLAYWLPTSLFVLRVSAHAFARAATRFFTTFLVGEAIKLVCCSILFIVFVKYCSAQLFYALMGLAVAIVAYWVSSVACLVQSRVKI